MEQPEDEPTSSHWQGQLREDGMVSSMKLILSLLLILYMPFGCGKRISDPEVVSVKGVTTPLTESYPIKFRCILPEELFSYTLPFG